MEVDADALAATIADGDRLVLDTNVLIAYLEGNQVITDAATLLLDDWIHSGRNPAWISTVSVMEVLVGPMKADAALTAYFDFLQRFPNLTCVPVDAAVAREAARIRASTGLRAPDALIVGTAVVTGAAAIVTNDDAIASKSPVPVLALRKYVV
ncbi:MAG: type II toxin-antitoxin system VapC family toxin [Vulcanimicrobiaceae bacterium]